MKSLKLIAASIAFSLLAACGGDGLEGNFEVSSEVMGIKLPSSRLLLTGDEVKAGNQTFKIGSWTHEGDIYTAFDEAGNQMMSLKEIDSNTYELLDSIGGTVWTRI